MKVGVISTKLIWGNLIILLKLDTQWHKCMHKINFEPLILPHRRKHNAPSSNTVFKLSSHIIMDLKQKQETTTHAKKGLILRIGSCYDEPRLGKGVLARAPILIWRWKNLIKELLYINRSSLGWKYVELLGLKIIMFSISAVKMNFNTHAFHSSYLVSRSCDTKMAAISVAQKIKHGCKINVVANIKHYLQYSI